MNKRIRTLAYLMLFVMFSRTLLATASLGEVSTTLIAGGSILYKLIWAVCIVVGIALIAASFVQFQIHRNNPKLAPLATPVLYLILGIAAIALPFIDQFKGFLSHGVQGVKSSAAPSSKNINYNDIDAPLN